MWCAACIETKLSLLCGRYVGINGGSGPPPPWAKWPQLIIGQAEAILPASVAAATAIKESSHRHASSWMRLESAFASVASVGWTWTRHWEVDPMRHSITCSLWCWQFGMAKWPQQAQI